MSGIAVEQVLGPTASESYASSTTTSSGVSSLNPSSKKNRKNARKSNTSDATKEEETQTNRQGDIMSGSDPTQTSATEVDSEKRRNSKISPALLPNGTINMIGTLQQYCQKTRLPIPVYEVTDESGPAHRRNFTIEVRVGSDVSASGSAANKNRAKYVAAYTALLKLNIVTENDFKSEEECNAASRADAEADGSTIAQGLDNLQSLKAALPQEGEDHPGARDVKPVSTEDEVAAKALLLINEFCARRNLPLPRYTEVGRTGAAHAPTFSFECIIEDPVVCRATAEGKSVKEAKRNAAHELVKKLKAESPHVFELPLPVREPYHHHHHHHQTQRNIAQTESFGIYGQNRAQSTGNIGAGVRRALADNRKPRYHKFFGQHVVKIHELVNIAFIDAALAQRSDEMMHDLTRLADHLDYDLDWFSIPVDNIASLASPASSGHQHVSLGYGGRAFICCYAVSLVPKSEATNPVKVALCTTWDFGSNELEAKQAAARKMFMSLKLQKMITH